MIPARHNVPIGVVPPVACEYGPGRRIDGSAVRVNCFQHHLESDDATEADLLASGGIDLK